MVSRTQRISDDDFDDDDDNENQSRNETLQCFSGKTRIVRRWKSEKVSEPTCLDDKMGDEQRDQRWGDQDEREMVQNGNLEHKYPQYDLSVMFKGK